LFGLVRQKFPSLIPSNLNPIYPLAHPASIIERALLDMSEEDFKKARPDHLNSLFADKPAQTGVKWIDEMEKQIFEID
jgi:hypothetical protein